MTIKTVTKEQLIDAAGTVLEPSPWYALTQERINQFADCTEDQQFIHIDEALAKQTPSGRYHRPRLFDPVNAGKDGRELYVAAGKSVDGNELWF